MHDKMRILFLGPGNACRSQMAEGWLRHLHSDRLEAFSASTESPRGLNLIAVRVLREAGVETAGLQSKAIAELTRTAFDAVIVISDDGVVPYERLARGGKVIARPFEDPKALALFASTEKEVLEIYRRIRDEICAYVEDLPRILDCPKAEGYGLL